MKKLTDKEFNLIGLKLQSINVVFRELWNRIDRMEFDEDVETVQLEITDNNNFRIVANPTYWKKCNKDKRLFIICHEMCHCAFGHWVFDSSLNKEWVNVAQDIQINEFLLEHYFSGTKCKLGTDFATIKVVFKHMHSTIKRNQDYMYYYNILMRCLKK
jgi:predicted metal-dependent peptidase